MSALADWPTDPHWFQPPTLEDFSDRRELELLVCQALCWWHDPHATLGAVGARDFRHGLWRTVFESLADLASTRTAITPDALMDHLAGRNLLGSIGGLRTITQLFTAGYPGGSPETFGRLLAEWARRDRLTATLAAVDTSDGTVDVDEISERLTADATPEFVAGIDRVSDVREAIDDRIAGVGVSEGVRCGLGALDEIYRVERTLWTVVTGVPGSSKSSVVDQMIVNLADREDWRFAIFSPESAPTDRHAHKLATMRAGAPLSSLSIAAVDEALAWVGEHFQWVNSTSGVTVDDILHRADVIHRRRSLQGLVMDPWNEVDREGAQESETLRISTALTKLRRWARRREAHLWVIAHPTKMQKRISGGYDLPTLYDISGSATWRDKADMGLVIDRDQTATVAPTKVHVTKVRFAEHGRLGTAQLAYDPITFRYRRHIGGPL